MQGAPGWEDQPMGPGEIRWNRRVRLDAEDQESWQRSLAFCEGPDRNRPEKTLFLKRPVAAMHRLGCKVESEKVRETCCRVITHKQVKV